MSKEKSKVGEGSKRPGFISRTANIFFPLRQSKAMVSSPAERLGSTVGNFKRTIKEQSGKASNALHNAPQWNTIEEVEKSWGVTEQNRPQLVRRYKLLVIGQSVLLVLILFSLLTIDTTNVFVLMTSALVILSAVICVLIYMASSLWRLHVLTKREPVNFVQWIKGQKPSTNR